MKRIFFIINFVVGIPVLSQVGIDTTNPNPKSILDIVAVDKGVLFPRLTTVQRDGISGLGAAELGMTVFNTSTKCYNVWNGTLWYEACGNTIDGKSDFKFNCATASLSSNLLVDEPANSVITLEIDASAAGSWSIQSNTISGVYYSGSGIITAPGVQLIRLTASGTPTAANNNAVFTFSDTTIPLSSCSVSVKMISRSTKTYTVLSLLPDSWNTSLGATNSSFAVNLKNALNANFAPTATVKIAGFNYTEANVTESLLDFTNKLNQADILWCGWVETNKWINDNDKIQAIKAWIDNKKGVAIIHVDDNNHAIFANILGFAGPYFGNQSGKFANLDVVPINGSFGDLRSQSFPAASSGVNQSVILGDGTVLATGINANSKKALMILKDNYIILGDIDWAGKTTLTETNVFGKLYMNIFEWAIKTTPIN